MTTRKTAFTLIELLTVIAITGVLLTIIVVPVFQSFNLLRTGQSYSEAQERARILLDRISREVSNSAGVRDNAGIKGTLSLPVPSGAGSVNPQVLVQLPFMKLDIVKPAEGEPEVDASGRSVFRDPVTGKIDPTLTAPKGQVTLPVTPGSTLVRYFVGLRDPFFGSTVLNGAGSYNNPYDGLLMLRGGGRDNLFVLYRAEIQPFVNGGAGFTPNSNYFDTDVNGNIILDDPSFFIPDGTAAKAVRIQNWLKKAVVQTDVSRFDLIQPVFDKTSRQVTYDKTAAGDFAPRLIPLVQFRPTRMTNEPANSMSVSRLGDETDNALNVQAGTVSGLGPDVLETQHGEWSNAIVRTWPHPAGLSAYDPAVDPRLIGRGGPRLDGSIGFSVYAFNPSKMTDDLAQGVELFDVAAYDAATSTPGAYPFSAAVAAANGRTGWLTTGPLRDIFVPYSPNSGSGKIIASFGINEVGTAKIARVNLPLAFTGAETIPQNDPGTLAPLAGPKYNINTAFDRLWNEHMIPGSAIDPSLIQRHIDLRLTPNEDGTFGPLFPSSSVNTGGGISVVTSGNANGFSRAAIVPGSEQVFGPDQTPGPNYGNEVRYTRTTRSPGINQYRINYTDQPEPDYIGLGLTPADLAGFSATQYDPTNFVSAAIQAQYKAGYIQLNSDPNIPLPNRTVNEVPFRVSYRFQFVRFLDTFAVDYDSRQVMSLLLTVRNYPQSSVPNPQTVTLKSSSTIRNFLR